MASSYPTGQEIKAMFEKGQHSKGGGGFMAHVDPQVRTTVMGDKHQLTGEHSSHGALKDQHWATFDDILDWDKPITLDVVQVIGGGQSSWASVEIKATGTANSGKPLNHECVYIVNFNHAGKIVEIRAYYDTAHMNDHVEAHKGL